MILVPVLAAVVAILGYFSTLRILCMATWRRDASAILLGVWLFLSWVGLAVILLAVFPFLFYSIFMLLRAW